MSVHEESFELFQRDHERAHPDRGSPVAPTEAGRLESDPKKAAEPIGGDTDADRVCSVCKQRKTTAQFYKDTRHASGLRSECKKCTGIKVRRYESANQNAISCRRKEKYISQDPTERKEKGRIWRDANAEKRRLTKKLWRQNNREEYNAKRRAAYIVNPERVLGYTRRWNAKNPDNLRASRHRRVARKRNAQGSHSAADIKEIKKQQRQKCAICMALLKNSCHIDHIVALSKGGSNDRRNIQLLCAPCNLKKGTKDMIEVMQGRGMLI